MTTESRIESALARWDDDPAAARLALIEHTRGRTEALARKMLRRDFPRVAALEETDDVVQEVQLRLLRALEEVRPDSAASFLKLAARQVRWELLSLARSHFGPHGLGRRQVPLDPGDADDSREAGHPGGSTYEPAKLAVWTELHERVATLPEDTRSVFELIWYQGLTYTESAEVLEVSESTIKRRWASARLTLGALVGEESS